MSDLPAEIDLDRHRDFAGRRYGQWPLRSFVATLIVFIAAALGQRVRPGRRDHRRRRWLIREEIGAEARLNNISSIAEVRWAILQTNGRISFVEKRRA